MKVTIICVGKIKEDFYRKAVSEYEKRLSRYCKLDIIEVQDEKTPDNASPALEEQIKEREAARIFKYIKEDAHVISVKSVGSSGEKPYSVYYWRIFGTASKRVRCVASGGQFFKYDISTSAYESYSFRTNL